ncbi:MAG: pyrimidine dimer DNA glycosylase/endonuclease V [Thermanaerothrix sp.]|nr:pyrimidine dimer DNA glycosylase/endonuclease V [Thermanaerothrix sp.]
MSLVRLWSLHPMYLDSKGLVALWREGLLAKAVLEGKTVGYRNHPQLIRFRSLDEPVLAVNQYLRAVLEEARRRGYGFDGSKLDAPGREMGTRIPVSSGQLAYEWEHLLRKLARRDPQRYEDLSPLSDILPHPMMEVFPGGVESWEAVK